MADLQTMTPCKRLTIVEGPDGGGKSTFARAYAVQTNAQYVHFGPMLKMGPQVGRVFVEAMQPALLGLSDVVFDRSWLSERPYGLAYRNGVDRIGPVVQRMLERLAMRCATVVVRCLPPWETVKASFLARPSEEYLKDTQQLYSVYRWYNTRLTTALPMIDYDFTRDTLETKVIDTFRTAPHSIDIRSAGNFNAPCVLVGESFMERSQYDPYYQWPFASFLKGGCSYWLTEQLHEAKIDERHLMWVNSDQPMFWMILPKVGRGNVFALSEKAAKILDEGKVEHTPYLCLHTQKRLHHKAADNLIRDLKHAMKGVT